MLRRRENHQTASPRVQEWLSKMTLDDKIGQMSQIGLSLLWKDDQEVQGVDDDKLIHYFGELGIGSLLNAGERWNATRYRNVMIRIQEIARNYSRPPVIWGLDSVHGANYVHGAIVTPQPINLAATFNVTMAHRAGQLASRDTRAAGINWLFSPILGLSLEPKWSRVYETFGEDPKLVTEMGHHMITGIQETQGGTVPSRAAACAKHFVGYSQPHDGHDRSPSWIPTRHLYQYFVPPWRRAINDVLTVMESYTEYDGVPNVANRESLNYLLRYRLGFDGLLLTDYSEILNLHSWHHIVDSDEEATIYSLQEGSVDMSMIPMEADGFRTAIENGIQDKSLTMSRIDQSVKRVLHLKEELGMFDEMITMDDYNIAKVGNDKDREEALEMARQSIILAENVDDVLPLSPTSQMKVHITGPTANSLQYQSGGWTLQWQGPPTDDDWFTYGATVLDAAKNETTWDVSYSCGVDILGNECTDAAQGDTDSAGATSIVSKFENWVGIGHGKETVSILESANMASQAKYVIVCVGEESYAEKPGDIRSLELPQGQLELVKALSDTDAKIILVYFGGRPRLLRQMVNLVDAVLVGFLPGPDAGNAVLDIISGEANPSGRMPLSYPKYEDGGGSPYYHAVSDRCTSGNGSLPHWETAQCEVQWPFGHGLSYTKFGYSDLELSSNTITYRADGQGRRRLKSKGTETLDVSVRVRNEGSRAGSETVMFFTFDESRHTTPEYKRLRSFEKVYLEPGEEKVVTASFSLYDPDFLSVGPHDDSHLVIQNGLRFKIGVGAEVNCNNPESSSSQLCSQFVTVDAGDDYSSVCDAACTVWSESGCGEAYDLSAESCWIMCKSSGQENLDDW